MSDAELNVFRTAEQQINYLKSLPGSGILGVTCRGRVDGVGAQAMAVLSVQTYCWATGVPYVHTPFETIKFPDDKPDWEGRWERFLNLGHGEAPVPQGVGVMTPDEHVAAGRPDDVVIAINNCHAWTQADGTADALQDMRPLLREKYALGAAKPAIDEPPYVAIHVRRGDVSADNRYRDRFTSDQIIIGRAARALGDRIGQREVHIFSQGDPDSFADFSSLGPCRLFLDSDVFETFHRMAMADFLIAGKSTFSYLAGLISSHEVRSETWFHRPLSGWYFDDQFLEASTSKLLYSEPAQVVETLEANRDLLEQSYLLKWNYAQALMRSDTARCWDALEVVAKSETMYAKAAAKTFCSTMAAQRNPDQPRLDEMKKLFATRWGDG